MSCRWDCTPGICLPLQPPLRCAATLTRLHARPRSHARQRCHQACPGVCLPLRVMLERAALAFTWGSALAHVS